MHSSIALLAAGLSVVSGAEWHINVGNGQFTMAPDTIKAAIGDHVIFHFFSSLHTVVEGTFDSPCKRKEGGFSSGSFKNSADGGPSVFQVDITDTDPHWFYCGTPTHCQGGMSGVINPPDDHTIADYQAASADAGSSEADSTVEGGCVIPTADSFSGSCPGGKANGGSSSSKPPASSTSPPASSTSPPASSTSPPASSTSAPASSTSETPASSTSGASSTAGANGPSSSSPGGSTTTSGSAPPGTSNSSSAPATIVPASGAGKTAIKGVLAAGLGFLAFLV